MTPEERADKLYWELDNIMGGGVSTVDAHITVVAAAIRAAVTEEREACAKICDAIQEAANDEHAASYDPGCGANGAGEAAAAIRARGADIPVEQMPVK